MLLRGFPAQGLILLSIEILSVLLICIILPKGKNFVRGRSHRYSSWSLFVFIETDAPPPP